MIPAVGTDAIETIWQEVECGSYAADLALFDRLATEAGGPVLDLGCGIGRVALRLASRGHEVTGLDAEPALLTALRADAAARNLTVEAVEADACDFSLDRRFALILAPMQLTQIVGGSGRRTAMLRCIAAHLAPGGVAALAVIEDDLAAGGAGEIVPDVRERDGWVYSSQPLSVRLEDDQIVIDRRRQAVSPDGHLHDQPNEVRLDRVTGDGIEAEARSAGLRPLRREEIPETEAHVASTVVVLGAEND
jgi:SAM-dependent methyltransferase